MKRAETAGTLYREKPFVMGFTGEELAAFGFGDGEKCADDKELTLIQGIIDAYFEEDGEIIVLDYKTDRVQTEAELKRPLPGTAPPLHQSPRTDHPEKSKRTDHLLLHPCKNTTWRLQND